MDASAVLSGSAGNTKKYDIPIGHLDYSYIEKCTDVKMLERIYRVLQSGDEGCYPHLQSFCEEKLAKLCPTSRVLRKEAPVASRKDMGRQERDELDEDLKNWTDSMKTIEDHLKTPAAPAAVVSQEEEDGDLPPIRSGNITLTTDGVKTKPEANTKKRAMPREYRDWDKIDVDKELEKVDDDDATTKSKTVVGNTVVKKDIDIPAHIDSKGLSDSEKLMKANREKDKGNEAFRSNDFKEAITYYSRSISLQPTAASYNNRALAYLKNADFQQAVADCNKVLTMEADNVKALLRRGTAYKSMKKYDTAIADFNNVLEMEPNNKRAKDLILETEKTIQKEKEERRTKGRRMKIEEVEEVEEEIEVESPPEEQIKSAPGKMKIEEVHDDKVDEAKKKPSRKMKIEEVDDDEDDEEDDEEKSVKAETVVKEATSVVNGKPVVNGFPEKSSAVTNDKPSKGQPQASVETKSISDKSCTDTQGASQTPAAPANNTTETSTTTNKSSTSDTDSEETESAEGEDDSDGGNTNNNETEEAAQEAVKYSRPVFYTKEYPGSCVKLREEANTLFKSGQYGDAQAKYTKVINLLENMSEQVVNLSLTYSNRAACHLKIGDLPGCVKDCNSSLDLLPHSVKPLLRRATAYEHLERYKKAYVDYRHVLLIDNRTEQAHLGTKRCQTILHNNDGPRWREKLQLPQVSPWDIPDVIGLDGKSTGPPVFTTPVPTSSTPSTSPSSSTPAPVSSSTQATSQPVKQTGSQQKVEKTVSQPAAPPTVSESSKPVQAEVKKPAPKKTPQEKFDEMKAQGNDHVKNGKFREAIQCYSQCAQILPDQTVSYTNRALCYIRLNQPENAEKDCNEVLANEKDNVKALFRRAQARKMLKRYRDGIEDLKHLLSVDPKNTAAKKEMDMLKNYWREELESMKKNLPTQSSSGTSKAESKPESKPCPRAAQSAGTGGKQRKKMVIEEVDSEEETVATGKQTQSSKTSHSHKQDPKIQEVKSKPVNQKSATAKPVSEKPTSKPVQSKSDTKTKQQPVNKKSQIRETSSGLPKVPKSVPKLDKATPYEFISAWNALKNTETVKPYYDLLKQIKPADIKTVISNKLDGNMLNVITRCVSEHYIANGEEDESYQILNNLSTVPRFGTVTMFMSAKEKSDVQLVMEKLSSHTSPVYSTGDIQKLRKLYSV